MRKRECRTSGRSARRSDRVGVARHGWTSRRYHGEFESEAFADLGVDLVRRTCRIDVDDELLALKHFDQWFRPSWWYSIRRTANAFGLSSDRQDQRRHAYVAHVLDLGSVGDEVVVEATT